MTCLLKLADRVEKSVVGSRELDAGIWDALGLAPKYDNSKNNYGNWHYKGEGRYHFSDDSTWGRGKFAPYYTTSLDAAVSLVPDGYDWAVFRSNGGLTSHAWCGSRDERFGETPALALCAAALRARHSAQ